MTCFLDAVAVIVCILVIAAMTMFLMCCLFLGPQPFKFAAWAALVIWVAGWAFVRAHRYEQRRAAAIGAK